ncbi:hypothetical protein Dimus_033448, partial [Dionaea muscipula]
SRRTESGAARAKNYQNHQGFSGRAKVEDFFDFPHQRLQARTAAHGEILKEISTSEHGADVECVKTRSTHS